MKAGSDNPSTTNVYTVYDRMAGNCRTSVNNVMSVGYALADDPVTTGGTIVAY